MKKPGLEIDDVAICRALKEFGPNSQIRKCIEELGELISELSRSFISNRDNRVAIAGEIADVLITVRQVSFIIGLDLVQARIDEKTARLNSLINEKSVPPTL